MATQTKVHVASVPVLVDDLRRGPWTPWGREEQLGLLGLLRGLLTLLQINMEVERGSF